MLQAMQKVLAGAKIPLIILTPSIDSDKPTVP